MKIKFFLDGYVDQIGEHTGAVEFDGLIPPDFAYCFRNYHLVDNALVYDNTVPPELCMTPAQMELEQLIKWFVWYDDQVMQYGRAVRTGESFDRDITALDAEAKAKQLRIREIREVLNG